MARMSKRLAVFAVAVLLVAGIVFAIKKDDIGRLMTVNTLFDEGRIVDNFSNMDRAFLTNTLDVPIRDDLMGDSGPLPDTVTIAGEERGTLDVLDELDTTALVILRDGEIIHESYYRGTGPDDRRISWSVAKSFLSGLYGAALENGAIASLDDDVTTYVPELQGTAYDGATLRNVLNMSSGVRYNEDYMDQDSDINRMGRTIALGGSLDDYTTTLTEQDFTPGDRWHYVSMDTHVAAWVLRAATGRSVHDLWEEIYGPLGFCQPPFYLTDGEGAAFALGGLNLTTRDYAKFGQLYLQDGEWNGQQLISADWVAASTAHSAPGLTGRGTGYGYQWWVPMPARGDFMASGIYGQFVYIDPARDIVIAKNAADREFALPNASGPHSMNMNIDLFRSLAERLGG
ncbi:serine hydrolase [uncultured Algimonas sp.]|uniref:serine hydrolase domain-containing protein n=1 Tax=uncultured Algimonas sp. TaxID=1547920 RepID=UPI002621CDE6|nr:serine hydrolase [uncultured Algimonas sp.]